MEYLIKEEEESSGLKLNESLGKMERLVLKMCGEGDLLSRICWGKCGKNYQVVRESYCTGILKRVIMQRNL